MESSQLIAQLAHDITSLDFTPACHSDRLPRADLQAQLHGNETTGALVLHDLAARYAQEGSPIPVRIVPHANPFAWDSYMEAGEGRFSRPGGQNWNRIFTGDNSPKQDSASEFTAEGALRDQLWRLSTD